MTKVLLGLLNDSSLINKHNKRISHPITNHNRASSHNLQRLYRMSNDDHLRPVTLPPALASATMCGLLPPSSGGKLLVPLPNEWCCQALHVRQLFGGASQLQSTFTNGLRDPNGTRFCFESLELHVDTGQVVIQFAVAHDIRSDAPVIKSMGCFGEVSINCGGADKELVKPGG